MLRSRFAGLVLACLGAYTLDAGAVTLDFQSLEHTDALQAYHGTSYTEQGFTIDAVSLYSNGTQYMDYEGSTALFFGNQGTIGTLSASSGSAFNLTSIDLAEVNPGTATVSFTGYLLGGGTVSQSFTLDGIQGGAGFQTFTFSGFTNLTHVEWKNEDPFHQFDNIVVSAVPAPAAIWLFASGLLGLIGAGRRRRTA